jgi:D-3-phosphoglycerate dehydrogenase
MTKKLNVFISGDAMIKGESFANAWNKYLSFYGDAYVYDWERDWDKLQYRRLEIEKHGPGIEDPGEAVFSYGANKDIFLGLFAPVSTKLMDAMPNLKIIGVSRAGLENVDVEEATRRGILVFNVLGRNAHAVSDFAVGMMLSECRNIARAHYAIKNGIWRKTFINTNYIPELAGRAVGLVGFGHIGRLVAMKLSGFNVKILVYDPYTNEDVIKKAGCSKVELDCLMRESDFVSIHARLTENNKNMIGPAELSLMKPTAYLINTSRAGLVDQDALADTLERGSIMGAALDVFTTEPIESTSRFLKLDNVTLTTHLAGTTADALANSPNLLAEDILKLFEGKEARFIVNPSVLSNEAFKSWLDEVRG